MITTMIQGTSLSLETDEDVFSPKGADKGTLAMLSLVTIKKKDKILDLGCGYGIVGIWAAKHSLDHLVTMCDISEKAVACSLKNAEHNQVIDKLQILQSDGLSQIIDFDYTLILSNPPYHVDFSVPKHFIEEGYRHLVSGGKMMMVTKRKDWYQNKLASVFGGVTIKEIDGYYIFIAEKRPKKKKPDKQPAPLLSKKLQRKMNRQKH